MKIKSNKKCLLLLQSMKNFHRESGSYPTVREVCIMLGTTSTSVGAYYLGRLEDMGLIERKPFLSRSMRFMDEIESAATIIRNVLKGSVLDAHKSYQSGRAKMGAHINNSRRRNLRAIA